LYGEPETPVRTHRTTARLLAVALVLGLPAGLAAAYPGSGHGMPPGKKGAPPPATKSIGRRAVSIAKRYLGVPYKWGGSTPKEGFDCSGFTMYVYAQLGIQLLHYTGDQWHQGYRVPRNQLRKGDLVFFHRSSDGPQHEGLYVGKGRFIHAPHKGDLVKISKLSDPNYKRSYVGAIRPYGYGPRIVFPVLGRSQYTNDFRAAKAKIPHEGIRIIGARESLVLATEAGMIKFWRSNRAAGCMLFLYGKSRTTYVYKHLNNDVSDENDNAGGCTSGIAYAPGLKSGSMVRAGELVGFLGDSGDANGVHPYLDFELHPFRGSAVNPYPYLNRGQRLLFAAARGGRFELTLRGRLVSAQEVDPTSAVVKLKVSRIRVSPGGYKLPGMKRTLIVDVTDETVLEQQLRTQDRILITLAHLIRVAKGRPLLVRTEPKRRSFDAQAGKVPFGAARVLLLPSS